MGKLKGIDKEISEAIKEILQMNLKKEKFLYFKTELKKTVFYEGLADQRNYIKYIKNKAIKESLKGNLRGLK